MADITVKITVRQGLITQLQRLSHGEFGMATDVNRLFIGSKQHQATGDGSQTVFTFGIDLDLNPHEDFDNSDPNNPVAYNLYYIDIDGSEQTYNSDYTVDNFKVTFTTPPANGAIITFTYNSEVMLTTPPEGIIDVPVDVEVSSGALTNQLFPSITIDPERFGSAKIRYSLVSANHRRNGVLDIALEMVNLITSPTITITDPLVPESVFNVDPNYVIESVTKNSVELNASDWTQDRISGTLTLINSLQDGEQLVYNYYNTDLITINDNYTQNTGSTLDHEFGKSIVDGQFVLTVTTTETQPVRMTWVEDHFAVATV